MVALSLLTLALTQGQGYERPEVPLRFQLTEGQELVYKGTCTEQSLVPGVQHQRQYTVEAIYLIHKLTPNMADAVLQTTVSVWEPKKPGKEAAPGSVRLDLMRIDRRGRLFPVGDNSMPLAIPVSGPALLESGAFFETPLVPVNRQSYWEEFEGQRPLRGWRMLGVENYRGVSCVKLIMSQQSADWKQPRADSTAWRRQDIIWFASTVGQVFRVQRTIERRRPARDEPTERIVTIYDLESMFKMPPRLFQERLQEIARSRKLAKEARPLLKQPAASRPRIDALLKRIADHVAKSPPTPYRKAIVHLQGKLERARTGELPAQVAVSEEPIDRGPVRVGQKAPDFSVTDLTSQVDNNLCRCHDMLGQTIFIFYYNPTTRTGHEALRFAQSVLDEHGDDVRILGMAASDDVKLILKQHEDMDLRFPIFDGTAMLRTFGVDGTPRFIVLDADGVVRWAMTGWGYQTADEINEVLRKCLEMKGRGQKKLPNIP